MRTNLYYIQNISKSKLKKEYTISSGTVKNTTSQTISLTSDGIEILDINIQSNCIKRKQIVIKCYWCSQERSCAVLIEVNSEFWSRSGPF